MLPRLLLLALLGAFGLRDCGGVTDEPPTDAGPTDAEAPDARPSCDEPPTLEDGDPTGHADPLGASSGEARAGRATAEMLPSLPTGLEWWEAGDYVLANDRVAFVVEDAGVSDGYDPWGGRPVGFARVEGGALVDPTEMGELFILTGRETLLTTAVTVMNDGSDGEAAVVRAHGLMRPLPFFDSITRGFFPSDLSTFDVAIDYVLEPDADHVDVQWVYASPRPAPARIAQTMHGYIYTGRNPTWAPGFGFRTDDETLPYIAFIDADATSYAYSRLDGEELAPGIAASGYKSNFTGAYTIEPCAVTTVPHARITLGGPGLDGLVQAVARTRGETLRTIAGTVSEASGALAAGVRVHVLDADGGHLTRSQPTGEDGAFAVHVPEGTEVQLVGYRQGDFPTAAATVAGDATSASLTMGEGGTISVTTTEVGSGLAVPVRVQVRPTTGDLPSIPGSYGEPGVPTGRLHVDYPVDGQASFRVAAGEWEVVVSRGYDYELYTEVVTVAEGDAVDVTAEVERVVESDGVQCADFHIHTSRSGDSADHARLKLRSAAADGLELPARSDHEYVEPWDEIVQELGLGAWMRGLLSVELTTFQQYGHFGVVPIEPADGPNGGTPLWQRYPTNAAPDTEMEVLLAPELFAQVRARPEAPAIIINHPRGGGNYFEESEYDRATGLPGRPEMWDEEFQLVEFFNSNAWRSQLGGLLQDWFAFLRHGRRVFAVGSSDSHGIVGSPVGYPRTCMDLGTDDPRAVTGPMVRDALLSGSHSIFGGIYVEAAVGEAGPGDDATGLGATATVSVRVQAASWVDVDALDVLVDGEVVQTVPIRAEDADPTNPVVRLEADLEVDVATTGSYVIVAAYGDTDLEPVHRRRTPFGVTNPIFLSR